MTNLKPTFGVRDVIYIVTTVISVVAVYWRMEIRVSELALQQVTLLERQTEILGELRTLRETLVELQARSAAHDALIARGGER